MEKTFHNIISAIGFRTFLIVLLLTTALLQFGLMSGDVRNDTYNITLGSVAPETIRATKTIEDTDQIAIEQEAAKKSVAPIYEFNEEAATTQIAYLDIFFDLVLQVQEQTAKKKLTTEQSLALFNQLFEEVDEDVASLSLSDEQKRALIESNEKQLKDAQKEITKQLTLVLQEPVRLEQLNSVKNTAVLNVTNAIAISNELKPAMTVLIREMIIPTEIVNQEKTDQARKVAADAVESTKILQGQIILLEGEIVTQEAYRQLQLLGAIDGQSSIQPLIGLTLLILLQMIFLFALFHQTYDDERKQVNYVLITLIIYMISMFMMKIISVVAPSFDVMIAFLYPTAVATILVRVLVNERFAAVLTVLIAASAGVMFQESYASVLQMEMALYILFGGFASILFLRNMEKRSHILQVSGMITILNLAFIAFYLLMTQTDYGLSEIGFYLVAAIVSGVLSGALTMGLLPFFESMFGILSTLRLIELSNPNHPLLKKILTETPGTYHHSVMVANLAEAACEAIGADGLLARVGCYYHDVGKTKRPMYFIENQMGINPHDQLTSEKSAEIILAHTLDGANLLRQHKMPKEIIDIALQHHGTSLLKYFWHKAQSESKLLSEAHFRYAGPKPQTKEAAIISVADSVEAAVRSMKEPNAEKIHQLVHSIIQDRIQDRQFDECDISLKELCVIGNVLCETLNGIFHSRIEYPKEKEKEQV